ncbi:hypothetical protein ACFQZR_12160 [Paenibacillus sp. GCM10027629]|uniref:hypothetical protein n=1 Tax=Paenibacillus sp. GCM10027629 TaxID=3273414 RepID=UPI00362A598E
MYSKSIRILIGVVFIVCVVGGVMVFQSTFAKSTTNQSHTNSPNYPENEYGQTYGSAEEAILVGTDSTQASGTSKNVAHGKDSSDISPRNSQVINPIRHTGKGAYTGEFTTAPENGKHLDVYYKNDGVGTVYMTIYRNGQEFII